LIDEVVSTMEKSADLRAKAQLLMPENWNFNESTSQIVDENARRSGEARVFGFEN
jgi:hypothetical protein